MIRDIFRAIDLSNVNEALLSTESMTKKNVGTSTSNICMYMFYIYIYTFIHKISFEWNIQTGKSYNRVFYGFHLLEK